MNRLYCFIFISCLFLLSACRKKGEISKEGTIITCEQKDVSLHISEFSDKAFLLPLETSEKSLFGGVDKLVFYDNKIYVLDQKYAAKIMVFDASTGKFISKIGTIGNGPGEYKSISDFSIDEEKKKVYVLTNRHKVMTYTLLGDFVHEKNLGFYADKMEYTKEHFYFICSDIKDDNLIITDAKYHKLISYFSQKEYGANQRMLIHPLYKKNNEIYYRRFLDNIVYKIDNVVSSVYKINLGKNELQLEELDKLSKQELLLEMGKSSCHLKYFVENEDVITYVYFDNNKPVFALYDKEKNKGNSCYCETLIDDYYGINMPLLEYEANGNCLVAVVSPIGLKEQMNDEGKKILESYGVTEESNPILYIIQTH